MHNRETRINDETNDGELETTLDLQVDDMTRSRSLEKQG
jgi:hypothetical protein